MLNLPTKQKDGKTKQLSTFEVTGKEKQFTDEQIADTFSPKEFGAIVAQDKVNENAQRQPEQNPPGRKKHRIKPVHQKNSFGIFP